MPQNISVSRFGLNPFQLPVFSPLFVGLLLQEASLQMRGRRDAVN